MTRASRFGWWPLAVLLAAAVALTGCAEIAKIPDRVESLPLPKAAEDDSYQIIGRFPGLESVEPERSRRSSGHQRFVETAKWKPAELTLARTSPTGRRYFLSSQLGTLEAAMRQRFGDRARDFDPLDDREHRIGTVLYQQFLLDPGQRCLALRAFDGKRPEEGFRDGYGIHESLGKTVIQGFYCKRGRKHFDARQERRILDSVAVRGF